MAAPVSSVQKRLHIFEAGLALTAGMFRRSQAVRVGDARDDD
jgi:hypothetical protein